MTEENKTSKNLVPRSTALTPAPSPEGSLSRYLQEIRKFPMLEADEEFTLAKQYAEDGNVKAAHRLVTSHLRLVAKIAMGYRGYGLPLGEVISEGNVGLMQAVKKFDADKGFRLATYAMWWIRASIQGICFAKLVAGKNRHHGGAKAVFQPASLEGRDKCD